MTGGLMNLVAYGNENILFNGNPKKTFFKATYNKYTNFGLQRFRIDFEGSRVLNTTTPTVLEFKIPRYAELLHDTYLVINLPNIYSPFYNFEAEDGGDNDTGTKNGHHFVPYEFRWIEELGTNFIEEIEIHSGGTSIAKYSGEYLNCIKERDFNKSKKDLWNRMTGNTPELNNPGNANGNINTYPNVFFSDANFDKAVDMAVKAGFSNQGQICLCGSRLFIEENIYNEFKESLILKVSKLIVGDPKDNNSDLGAVVSKNHMEKILSRIKEAKKLGGKILIGGSRKYLSGDLSEGYYIEPTVIEGLSYKCSINQEEIFGPVLTLIPFKNEEDVIMMAME